MTAGVPEPHATAEAAIEPVSAHEDHHSTDQGEPMPGPVDWGAWALSGLGVVAAAAIAVVLFVAIQHG